ncbi:MAG: hypothetical protein V9G24_21095 [Rhodoblastus sp.]
MSRAIVPIRQIDAREKFVRHHGEVEGLVGDEGDEMRDHPDEDGYAENAARRDEARLTQQVDQRRDRERDGEQPDRPEAGDM